MSISTDTMTEDVVDFSDFSHQVFTAEAQSTNAGSTGNYLFDFEALAGQGGLRPNQVAELVGFTFTVSRANEPEGGNDGSTAELRGVFGINLSPEDDITDLANGIDGETTVIDDDGGNGQRGVITIDSPSLLMPFSGGGSGSTIYERLYRSDSLTGRGPVVDSDDEISVLFSNINAGGDVDYMITGKLLWDLYEVDDARSQFAVPMSD